MGRHRLCAFPSSALKLTAQWLLQGREEAYSLSQDTQMLPSEIVAASRASLASPFEALASDAVAGTAPPAGLSLAPRSGAPSASA